MPDKKCDCLHFGSNICHKTYRVSKYFASNFLVDPIVCCVKNTNNDDVDQYLFLPPLTPTSTPVSKTTSTKSNIQSSEKESDGIIRYKRNVSYPKKIEVASKQHWKCQHCNEELDETFEIDHIIALCFGGTNEINNLAALCAKCHRRKTKRERDSSHTSQKRLKPIFSPIVPRYNSPYFTE